MPEKRIDLLLLLYPFILFQLLIETTTIDPGIVLPELLSHYIIVLDAQNTINNVSTALNNLFSRKRDVGLGRFNTDMNIVMPLYDIFRLATSLRPLMD